MFPLFLYLSQNEYLKLKVQGRNKMDIALQSYRYDSFVRHN